MEHTSDTGNPNIGEDDEDLTSPLGQATTVGGVDDNGYDSSSSNHSSGSRSSIHSQRSIGKLKKVK